MGKLVKGLDRVGLGSLHIKGKGKAQILRLTMKNTGYEDEGPEAETYLIFAT